MDFLKSCTTNLYAVEGYATIEYQIYTAPQSDQDSNAKDKDPETKPRANVNPSPTSTTTTTTSTPWGEERRAILVELRRRGALAQSAAVQKKICIFGGFSQAEDHMKELRWPLALTGRLEVSSLSRPGPDAKINVTNQNIYGMFLSAVEESLSITLGDMCRAIRVGYMNWIIPTESQDETEADAHADSRQEYSLLTLRTQITAIGTVLLLPEVVSTTFNTVSQTTDDTKPILLAPSGTVASVGEGVSSLSLKAGDSDANKGRHQLRREARARLAQQTREDGWKSSVKSRLGYSTAVHDRLDDSTHWTRVKVRVPSPKSSGDALLLRPTWNQGARAGTSCLWPTKLCFESNARNNHPMPTGLDDLDWIKKGTYQRPLDWAETWFLGKQERDEAALAEQKRIHAEAEAEAEAEREMAASQIAEPPPDQVALSSPVNIRTQDQSSANGIYPTPPDGLPLGIFADTMTSATIADDAGPSTVTEDYSLTRQTSNVSAPDAAVSRKNSTDELFDDMDEEMFGVPDVDVTDADFSFFDDTNRPGPERPPSSNRREKAASANAEMRDPSPSGGGGETAVVDGPPTAPATISASVVPDAGSESVDTVVMTENAENVDQVDPSVGENELHSSAPTPAPSQNLQPIEPEQPMERPRTPPLSPLQIKERFLPSPIPARVTKSDRIESPETVKSRRSSNFNHVVFRGNITSFDAKYGSLGRFSGTQDLTKPTGASPLKHGRSHSIIDLPPRKRSNANPNGSDFARQSYHQRSDYQRSAAGEAIVEESSSDDSDTASSSSFSDSDSAVPTLLSGKRKRMLGDDGASMQSPRVHTDNDSDMESTVSEDNGVDYTAVLELLLSRDAQRDPQKGVQESQHKFGEKLSVWRKSTKAASSSLPPANDYWDMFDFTQEDLISVAQLVAQQSINPESNECCRDMYGRADLFDDPLPDDRGMSLTTTYSAAHKAIRHVFSIAADCDFSKLAAVISIHAEQTSASKGQPRPTPTPRRANGGSTGAQQLFAIQPPPVSLQRSGIAWEMLPSSLCFWESLGLEPASGPKHVTSYAIYPETGDFGEAVEEFLDNIGLAYENCKLGSHVRGATYTSSGDGLVGFDIPENSSTRTLLECMRTASVEFGDLLREEASLEVDRAVVVYMFTSEGEENLTKFLCGCFWAMQQALAEGSDPADDPFPDFILQVVPVSRVASPSCLALPDPTWLASLAAQVYDRIPQRSAVSPNPVWVIPSAPSVQLSAPLPRKINFTLHERPPKSLLEEAQILHVAYAPSADGSWLTAAWTDNTGKYQFNTSFYTRNADGKAVLAEVRDMTLALIKQSTWRIFVARVGTMRNWEKEVWKEVTSDSWAITLLDVDIAPTLHISATDTTANHPAIPSNGGAGFITPASTPQAANFTVSPEASTPAALEEQSAAPDPDAYLIDTTDETWGLVIPFSAVHGPYELKRTMASGLLLKRGRPNPAPSSAGTRDLPSLGVDIVDILMPRLAEGQATWLAARTHDALLREVLSWYRGLGLLTRLRGLDRQGCVPWHVRVACKGVEALEGFLD